MTTFTKIHEGTAERDKTFALINRGYGPDQTRAGQWFETTEEIFDYFLEVLPPLDWTTSGFSMREFSTGHLTDCFLSFDGRFFCLTIHRERPQDFIAAVTAFFAALSEPVS